MEFLVLMAIITGVLTYKSAGYGFISGSLFMCAYAVKLYEDYKQWKIEEKEADRRHDWEVNHRGPLKRE